MDNLTLDVLLRELRPAILEKTILKLKMSQYSQRTLSLKLLSDLYLVVWLHAREPLVFLAREEVVADSEITGGVAALRKHLTGSKIRGLRKELIDRRISVDIENFQHTHQPEKYTLVLELIPPRPDIILLDSQGRVLASLLRETGSPAASECYCPAPRQPALRLEGINSPEFEDSFRLMLCAKTEPIEKFVGRALGLSPLMVQEMTFGVGFEPGACLERLRSLIRRMQNGPYEPHLYSLSKVRMADRFSQSDSNPDENPVNSRKDRWLITPFAFDSLHEYSFCTYPSMILGCRDFFGQLKSRTEVQIQKNSSLAPIVAAIKRKSRLLGNLQEDLDRFQGAEALKRFADLLYTQPLAVQPRSTFLRMPDLFDPLQAEIEIPLDPRLNLVQNANRYSQLFKKANRAVPRITRKMKALEAEMVDLQAQRLALENMERSPIVQSNDRMRSGLETDLRDLHRGRKASATLLAQRREPASQEAKVARQYISSEGLLILVGKTSRDNDTLTLKIARGEDFWFHVAGYAGSHVVLRNPEKLTTPPRRSLLEAAQLAAYFSQARNAPKVEVHFTQRRMVSKPKGARPGLVRLKEYESLLVKPKLPGEPD
jgi:predicted ribosome quality control (RQC) complex YloA/Tae2 family protein